MQDILTKLESADGPDHALDGEIFAALGGEAWEAAKVRASMPSGAPADVVEREARVYAPYFTRSLDAALSILPNWSWRVGNLPSGRGFASVGTQDSMQNIEGSSPAVAVCIAAIRARIAQTGEQP